MPIPQEPGTGPGPAADGHTVGYSSFGRTGPLALSRVGIKELWSAGFSEPRSGILINVTAAFVPVVLIPNKCMILAQSGRREKEETRGI